MTGRAEDEVTTTESVAVASTASQMRTLCLGETLVDLICERAVADFAEADAFVPRFGGATANVAVSAARHGASVGLASAVGSDAWGRWLHQRLLSEGVDLTWFRAVEGIRTPLACIVLSSDGEPTFAIYGEELGRGLSALSADIEDAVAGSDALFFGSNTLVGPTEREVTERARAEALRRGRPVIIDANLRLERWPDVRTAVDTVRSCLSGALLARTNRAEAEILTGQTDPAEAARALVDAGARVAVVTLGEEGALLAGEGFSRAAGVKSQVRSTIGAGDAFTGALVAALSRNVFDPAALVDALPSAVAAGARATEYWGALGTAAGLS